MNVDLKKLIAKHGVKPVYKALTQVHQFDPEIAWLSMWWARYASRPKRFRWGLNTVGVIPVVLTRVQIAEFLQQYNTCRGRYTS